MLSFAFPLWDLINPGISASILLSNDQFNRHRLETWSMVFTEALGFGWQFFLPIRVGSKGGTTAEQRSVARLEQPFKKPANLVPTEPFRSGSRAKNILQGYVCENYGVSVNGLFEKPSLFMIIALRITPSKPFLGGRGQPAIYNLHHRQVHR